MALVLFTAGCVEEDETLNENEQAIELASNQDVFATATFEPLAVDESFTLPPGAGRSLYALGTATSTNAGSMLEVLKIVCGSDSIQSSQNHVGTSSQWIAGRLLVMNRTPNPVAYSCQLLARVSPASGGGSGDKHTFLAGGATKLNSGAVNNCDGGSAAPDWSRCRWGTDDDTIEHHPDQCDQWVGGCMNDYTIECEVDADCPDIYTDGVYIGPHSPNGTAEYVLHGERFNVAATAPSLSVYAEPELTTCYSGTGSCPPNRSGGSGTTTVELQMLVQQMSGTSVCSTTYVPSTPLSFTISQATHHKKAHLTSNSITFNAACTGRSFIVKTKVQWISGPDVKVEYGTIDPVSLRISGFSDALVYANN
jgi:hypothetical protein